MYVCAHIIRYTICACHTSSDVLFFWCQTWQSGMTAERARPRVFRWGMCAWYFERKFEDPWLEVPSRPMPHLSIWGFFFGADWTQVDRSKGRRNCVERQRGNLPKPTRKEWPHEGCAGTGRRGVAMARNPAIAGVLRAQWTFFIPVLGSVTGKR
jgi:hypothetical protein